MVEEQLKSHQLAALEGCRQKYDEVAGWIARFGANNRLEITSETGVNLKLEIFDGLVLGTRSWGLGEVYFQLGQEGLCRLQEKRLVKTTFIEAEALAILTLENDYFEKLPVVERIRHTQEVCNGIKWDLEMAGLLPKR